MHSIKTGLYVITKLNMQNETFGYYFKTNIQRAIKVLKNEKREHIINQEIKTFKKDYLHYHQELSSMNILRGIFID